MNCKNDCQCTIFHQDTLDKVKKAMPSDDAIGHVSEIFKIMGDKTRVRILYAVSEDALCVCDLATLLGVTKSAVSHQMKVLKQLDLVESRKDKKMVYYRLKDHKMHDFMNEIATYRRKIDENNRQSK